MKHFMKSAKSICALVLSVVLIMSMSTVAFAADSTTDTSDEISAILASINAEYGTNIHVLSDNELAKYGLTNAEPQSMPNYEQVDLEETLRYIAEVQIPQFERTTEEAIAVMESVGIDPTTMSATNNNEVDVLSTASDPVVATKAIDYAIAGAEAYITTDYYGNTVWGSILSGFCYSNMYQETWFMALNPTVTHIDGRKTLYWTGTGDYCAYINGTQYYLYSGTQYASMYVGNYT